MLRVYRRRPSIESISREQITRVLSILVLDPIDSGSCDAVSREAILRRYRSGIVRLRHLPLRPGVAVTDVTITYFEVEHEVGLWWSRYSK